MGELAGEDIAEFCLFCGVPVVENNKFIILVHHFTHVTLSSLHNRYVFPSATLSGSLFKWQHSFQKLILNSYSFEFS